MKIETIVVGELRTNCYIAYDLKTRDAIIIDPGAESDKILKSLAENNLKPIFIVITHGHPDHYADANALSEACAAKIVVHDDDAHILQSKILTLRGLLFPRTRVDRKLKDGETLKFGGEELRVIHTPGHSRGGICLYSEKDGVLFSGDTLFYGDYGRTDLPGSSPSQMAASLKMLMSLPPETKVYPGHGPCSTIGEEKNNLGEIDE